MFSLDVPSFESLVSLSHGQSSDVRAILCVVLFL